MAAQFKILFVLIFVLNSSYGKKDTFGSTSYTRFSSCQNIKYDDFKHLNVQKKSLIPEMFAKKPKGYLGVIGIMGGVSDTVGALSFAGLGALRVGADVVHIFLLNSGKKTEWLYPDFVIHHHTREDVANMLQTMQKMDVILLGPGLDNVQLNMGAVIQVIKMCKEHKKPLILNLGEYFYAQGEIFKSLEDYPEPGAIVMLNSAQFEKVYPSIRAKEGFSDAHVSINFNSLGPNVLIYRKGCVDMAFSKYPANSWTLQSKYETKRARGQGSVIAGMAATYFHWARQSTADLWKGTDYIMRASAATYAAADVMRESNQIAVSVNDRSTVTSNMLDHIKDAIHSDDSSEEDEEVVEL